MIENSDTYIDVLLKNDTIKIIEDFNYWQSIAFPIGTIIISAIIGFWISKQVFKWQQKIIQREKILNGLISEYQNTLSNLYKVHNNFLACGAYTKKDNIYLEADFKEHNIDVLSYIDDHCTSEGTPPEFSATNLYSTSISHINSLELSALNIAEAIDTMNKGDLLQFESHLQDVTDRKNYQSTMLSFSLEKYRHFWKSSQESIETLFVSYYLCLSIIEGVLKRQFNKDLGLKDYEPYGKIKPLAEELTEKFIKRHAERQNQKPNN